MILVTGANGILGSRTCKALLDSGYDVKALVRPNSDLSLLDIIKSKIQLLIGDILIPEEITDHLADVNIIIHCAALVSFKTSDKELMNQINVQGTANLANLALNNGIEYFIHISSVAAIGRRALSNELDEDTEWEDGKWNTNYAHSKMMAEMEIRRSIEEGLNAVILNPSVIISPDDIKRSSGQLFNYVLEERKFYPSGSINYVDVRDVVNAILTCVEKRVDGKRYILNSGKERYQYFFKEVAERMNKTAPSIKASKILLTLGVFLDFLRSAILRTSRMITKETALVGQSDILFKSDKVTTDLGITFKPLNETLDWACQKIISKRA